MAETNKPPQPELGKLQKLVDNMKFHAKLHDSAAAAPKYNYAQSSMQADYKTLDTFVQTAGVPDSIKTEVAKLNQLFQDTQANILKGNTGTTNSDATQKTWDDGFKALQQKIETEKNSPVPPGGVDPKQGLDELSEKVKALHNDSLFNETQRMNDKLAEQQRRAMDDIRLQTTAMVKYNNDLSMAIENRWKNISSPNAVDPEKQREDQNANFSITTANKPDSPRKDYGTLESKDSRYLINYDNKNGVDSFKATYQSEPPVDGARAVFQGVVQILTNTVGLAAVVVAPVFELCSCLLAGAGYLLSGGKLELPYVRPFATAGFLMKDHFERDEGTMRGGIKAEISAAQDYAHKDELTVHNTSSDMSTFGKYSVDHVVIMLDEMKKKAGYTPGSPVGSIGNPKDAMGLKMSNELRSMLTNATSPNKFLSKESEKILRQMYKARNNGSDKGFKVANFKSEIFREYADFQKAIENSKAITNSKDDVQAKTNDQTPDPSNTSTITKAKEAGPVPTTAGELSTGQKQGEATPTPSPPPSPTSSQPGAPTTEGKIGSGQMSKATFVPSTEPSAPPEAVIRSGPGNK